MTYLGREGDNATTSITWSLAPANYNRGSSHGALVMRPLTHQARISRPHLTHQAHISRPHLTHQAHISRPHLTHQARISRPHLTHQARISRPHLTHQARISRPHLTHQAFQPAAIHILPNGFQLEVFDGYLLEEVSDTLSTSQQTIQLHQEQRDLGIAILGCFQQKDDVPQSLEVVWGRGGGGKVNSYNTGGYRPSEAGSQGGGQ